MNSILQLKTSRTVSALLLSTFVFSVGAFAADANVKVSLHGSEEVPPVTTAALGTGTIKIADDRSVSGSIATKGIVGTAAHIHVAEKGKNGPPLITLIKTGDAEWSVPAGAKLTDAQYVSFKAGDFYINVHSDANKNGEIRGQLKP